MTRCIPLIPTMSEEKEEDDLQPGGGLARVWVEKGS